MARLADFKSKGGGWGEPLSSIANVPVTITDCRIEEGKYGDVYIMTVVLPSGEVVSVYTGATVVSAALEAAMEAQAFPLEAVFVRRKRYWDIE